MGAGASVNAQTSQDQNQSGRRKTANSSSAHLSSSGETSAVHSTADSVPEHSPMKMSCETCSVTFTFFKRKKCCKECHRYFCSSCLPKPPASSLVGRQCNKCQLLIAGHFSRDDLQNWKIKDMRCFLNARNISTKECREKHDLIELVLANFCRQPRQSIQDQEKHEHLVRQMAAHVRDVSSVNIAGENNQDPTEPNVPSSSTASRQRVPQTSSMPSSSFPTSPPPPSSSSSSTTMPPPPPYPSSSSGEPSGGGGGGNRAARKPGGEGSGVNTSQPAGGAGTEGQEEVVLDRDQLRELLETMERIQDVLANHAEDGEEEAEEASGQPVRRAHLDDINTEDDIEGLSVRQLKELLVNNFVDFKGCCEKPELVERVRRLRRDYLKNKEKAEKIHMEDEMEFYGTSEQKPGGEASKSTAEGGTDGSPPKTTAAQAVSDEAASPSAYTTTNTATAEVAEDGGSAVPDGATENPVDISTSENKPPAASVMKESSEGDASLNRTEDLCHICMDSLVDCILLECGHMVTCTQCGKRLADCPICRQYVVRVVRVFRS